MTRDEMITGAESLDDLQALFNVIYGEGLGDAEREAIFKEVARRLKTTVEGIRSDWKKYQSIHDPAVSNGNAFERMLADDEPWPEDINGEVLLNELAEVTRRYIVLPDGAATAIALWVVFSHAHDAFQISPILAAVSPEKRCGKTTTQTLIGRLVPRALSTCNVTAAAMFRSIETYRPTLMIDEADSFLTGKNANDELRGVLNSGHQRSSAFVVRCDGDNNEPKPFSTWAPKSVALIGALPSTLEDRSIVIHLRRKLPGEKVDRLRGDRLEAFTPLRRRAARWAKDHTEVLRVSDPDIPGEIASDRARDNWRQLLAIADAAGGDWPETARRAAITLSGGEPDNESIKVLLLCDLRDILTDQGGEWLATEQILKHLLAMEERPWREWARGKGMNANTLARQLKPFGIKPFSKKAPGTNKVTRGYQAADLSDAIRRYAPTSQPATAATGPESFGISDYQPATEPPPVAGRELDFGNNYNTVAAVAGSDRGDGGNGGDVDRDEVWL